MFDLLMIYVIFMFVEWKLWNWNVQVLFNTCRRIIVKRGYPMMYNVLCVKIYIYMQILWIYKFGIGENIDDMRKQFCDVCVCAFHIRPYSGHACRVVCLVQMPREMFQERKTPTLDYQYLWFTELSEVCFEPLRLLITWLC